MRILKVSSSSHDRTGRVNGSCIITELFGHMRCFRDSSTKLCKSYCKDNCNSMYNVFDEGISLVASLDVIICFDIDIAVYHRLRLRCLHKEPRIHHSGLANMSTSYVVAAIRAFGFPLLVIKKYNIRSGHRLVGDNLVLVFCCKMVI